MQDSTSSAATDPPAGSEELQPAPDEPTPEPADTAPDTGAEVSAETPPPEDITVPAEEWDALQHAKVELDDRLLRLQAEFENYRKRNARERVQVHETATEEVTRAFLVVVDNVDRALASAVAQGLAEDHLTGWRLIHQQLYDVLRSLGVQPMAVVGESFDPRYHEALTHCPDAEIAAGHIVAEVERGYMVADRVLRIARVTVSSGPAAADDAEG